jgi:hypothetical protein
MGFFKPSVEIYRDDILTIIKEVLREPKAGEKVYLISPYWKLNTNFRDNISDAIENRIHLRCLIRAGEGLTDEDRIFVENVRLDMRFLDHLHAKLYWSPRIAVVTSMNLHNYSDKETREIALVINDNSYLKELEALADSWWDKASRQSTVKQAPSPRVVSSSTHEKRGRADQRGFCIRCGKPKTYSTKYPHCEDCWPIYAKHKDKKHTEKVCHGCGQQILSSQARPLCGNCYQLDPFDKNSA